MEQKSKKFVGNGRLLTSKDSTGFGINICITDLFEMCMKDPEVAPFIYVSEKTGKKYLPLVAWPLRDLKEGEKLRTHAVSIDTYVKPEGGSKPSYTPPAKQAKENKFDEMFEDPFPTKPAASLTPTSLLSDDDLPF